MPEIFTLNNHHGSEKIILFSEERSHLKGIIAVDDTTMGPALGGCRLFPYMSDTQALTQVIRLAKCMTLKNALFNLPYGGGKALIFQKENVPKRDLLQSFAEVLNQINGIYYTTDDVNTDVFDMEYLKNYTPYVRGIPYNNNLVPSTAYGVYIALKATLKYFLNKDTLQHLRISIQGLGKVGFKLCEYLSAENVQLWVSDLNESLVTKAVKQFNAIPVSPEEIAIAETDIFCPCAIEDCITEDNINLIKADYIIGSANNPLATRDLALKLAKRKIIYIPDCLSNAGGVIDIFCEGPSYSLDLVLKTIKTKMNEKTIAILTKSDHEGKTPLEIMEQEIANTLREKRIQMGREAIDEHIASEVG